MNAESFIHLQNAWLRGKSQELNNAFTKLQLVHIGRGKKRRWHIYFYISGPQKQSNKAGIYQLRFPEVSEDKTAHVFTGKFN